MSEGRVKLSNLECVALELAAALQISYSDALQPYRLR